MTYAEFKRLDTYKNAEVIELVNENGNQIDYDISEEELEKMDVKGYFVKNKWLTLELGESIEEFL